MAKIEPRRLPALLADPGSTRAVLLHGDDAGLARERAEALVRAVLGGSLSDPFRLAEMTREEAARPGALAGEAAALAMTGGRRVVRLRDATDAHAGPLKEALASGGEALLVLEGGELTARSRLRAMAEAAPDVAVVACWRERADEAAATLTRLLREQGVGVEAPVANWLALRLGEDRMLLRRAVEVLALYAGRGGKVDEDAALACVAEGEAADLDGALMAATAGEARQADRALEAAFAEGANPVMVVRATLRHVQRLHEAALAGDSGGLRPPVFFRHKPAFDRALRIWPPAALEAQGAALLEAEKRTKTTAFREVHEALARAGVAALARQAAALARR
ncbi:DNA polymerase III subunit delta [Falsiroseomonas selenitidurans]|uniref:DNA-directed DNA polymerase n=1 Tax=Falsiroseomonas selenitidurans TaxID=2716335 RepID=A0ABX1EBK5_9PROT|nr:DNA polymerase III subunit delta [Falsiroseomonas selenitidurans]NKC34569.1 DNA polymerase III subunit delta [Falsiroseomonas selenitidurans]